jgi:hypothetical protein
MSWIDDLPAEVADSLSDEVKVNPTLNQYKSLEAALEGHIQTKSAMGHSIRIPGDEAGETDRKEFLEKLINNAPQVMMKPDFSNQEQSQEYYRTIGVPDEFSKYENPEGFNLDTEVEGQLRGILHGANLTNQQYQEVVSKLSSMQNQTTENNTFVKTSEMEALAGKWGMTLDARMEAAKKTNDEFYQGRDFGNLNASEIEALYTIHTSLTGKGAQGPLQPETSGGMTPQEAEDQAAEIMRRLHDPKSEMTHQEKMVLVKKRIKMLETFVPRFAAEAQ